MESVAQQQTAPPGNQRRQGGRNRANFDPAQARQSQLDRIRERLEVKEDDAWKALAPLVEKVMEAQREDRAGIARGAFGGGARRNGGNQPADANANAQRPLRAGAGAASLPEAEALQQAIEQKLGKDELKARLAKLREVRKSRDAKLATAQENLRNVLSVRQECAAVLLGLLK